MTEGEVCTLYVGNIGDRLVEQDLVDLFQQQDGFVAARLRIDKHGNPVGFVDFEDVDSANSAKDTLQGHKFEERDFGLRVELSRSGPRGERNDSENNNKKRRFEDSNNGRNRFDRDRDRDRGDRYDRNRDRRDRDRDRRRDRDSHESFPDRYRPSRSSRGGDREGGSSREKTTLFVQNVPMDASTREMSHIFRPFDGYQSCRVVTLDSKSEPGQRITISFIDFDSKYEADQAMSSIQGYLMDQDDNVGLKISFSKQKERSRD